MYPCVGVKARQKAQDTLPESGEKRERRRAPSLESVCARVREMSGEEWMPKIYVERVRTLRTRSFQLPVANDAPQVAVQHTLLGVELKIGHRRLSCPDLATARYLSIFARAGCAEVAVPYDITKISRLADDLESAWQRALLLAEHLTEGRAQGFRTRVRKSLMAQMRRELEEAGAGAAVPQFKQDTRQRLYREPQTRARRA